MAAPRIRDGRRDVPTTHMMCGLRTAACTGAHPRGAPRGQRGQVIHRGRAPPSTHPLSKSAREQARSRERIGFRNDIRPATGRSHGRRSPGVRGEGGAPARPAGRAGGGVAPAHAALRAVRAAGRRAGGGGVVLAPVEPPRGREGPGADGRQDPEPARRDPRARRDRGAGGRGVRLLAPCRAREPAARLRGRTGAARGVPRLQRRRRTLPALQRALRGGARGGLRDRRAARAQPRGAGLAGLARAGRDGVLELCRPALLERPGLPDRGAADRRAPRGGLPGRRASRQSPRRPSRVGADAGGA